jgi:polysaccharide biosynthesis protein PelC
VPRSLLRTALLVAALGTAACGGPRQYVNQSADLSAVKTVAVLPFENVTNDKLSSERVQRVFVTELLNLSTFQVVEPGMVVRAMRKEQLDAGALTPDDIKRLGTALKAEALFLGTVLEYDEGRGGTTLSPQVKLQFRMVDTQTGTTLWATSRSRGGATISARLFGVGGVTASQLAEDLIREELRQFRH